MIHSLRSRIRTIPDYPKPGVMFRDITTLLQNPPSFHRLIDEVVQLYVGQHIDKVAAIEARGFILGGAVAHQLGAGFVPLRKKGKLPHHCLGIDYELEYGTDRIEIHADAVNPGERAILIDDLVATGGTAVAAIRLLQQAGAEVVSAAFAIALPDLGGLSRIEALGVKAQFLCQFSSEELQ